MSSTSNCVPTPTTYLSPIFVSKGKKALKKAMKINSGNDNPADKWNWYLKGHKLFKSVMSMYLFLS